MEYRKLNSKVYTELTSYGIKLREDIQKKLTINNDMFFIIYTKLYEELGRSLNEELDTELWNKLDL